MGGDYILGVEIGFVERATRRGGERPSEIGG